MNAGPLALVVAEPEGSYAVADSRDGLPIAHCVCLGDAAAVASYVNATYPTGSRAPARDSLAHEITAWRLAGTPPAPLSRVDTRGMIPGAV